MINRQWILNSLDQWLNSLQNFLQFLHQNIPGFTQVWSYFEKSIQEEPARVLLECFLLLFAIKYLFATAYRPESQGETIPLTQKEIEELIDEWEPESLVPPLSMRKRRDLQQLPVICGPVGSHVKLLENTELQFKSGDYLNMASYDFLALSSHQGISETSAKSVRVYGVGACGPPGFYGTIDVHIELENHLAKFIGVEEAIIYSQAFATISSVIPAFAKRGDILVVDEGVNFAVQKGVQISRSVIKYFRHNDMEDLQRVLESIKNEDKKNRRPLTRRFIVVEGLYQNHGDIAPLPELVRLKKKYKYRLICDESHSFGVLGRRGAGLADHFMLDPASVDIMSSAMTHTLAAAGGFCAGSKEVVDHQRLSGVAYCFSAAMPAMLAVAANEGLNELEKNGSKLLDQLRQNISTFVSSFGQSSVANLSGDVKLCSPILHLRLRKNMSFEETDDMLQTIVETMIRDHKILLTRSKYILHQELHPPKPSIRIVISSGHTKKELESAAKTLKKCVESLVGR